MARAAMLVFAGVLAVALVGALFIWLDDRSAPAIIIDDPRPDQTIVVVVEGAVVSPGVYSLPGDARTHDAIEAAGGRTVDADLASVNLARRLKDEERIVVAVMVPTPDPNQAADLPSQPQPAKGTTVPGTDPSDLGMPIDLNLASAAEFETLPEIGPTLAQRIVDYRTENGPFQSVDDLTAIDGISQATVDAVRELLTVGP